MYNAIAVANYFVRKGVDARSMLTPMQVNKLVFISHGWYLAVTSKPLILESPQAWKHGPVVSSVYHWLKRYGGDPVDVVAFPSSYEEDSFAALNMDENAKRLLDAVWSGYGKKTGMELSSITHVQNSPWDIVWNREGAKNKIGVPIPDQLIREYYLKLKEKNASARPA